MEIALADLWRDVLKVERINRHDNFFELGGHSLLAIWVMRKIRERFRLELPLRTLFEAPTLSELSASIVLRLGDGQADSALDGYDEGIV